jgi:pimeloyl-ACP methyl ester carboxylesterase
MTPGVLEQLSQMLSLPSFLFAPARRVITQVFTNAPAAVRVGPCPVILFSHGFGIGTVGQNTMQFCELASHGYVVVSIGHPYESSVMPFPDGRIVTADMARWKRVLREFAPGKLKPLTEAMNAANSLSQHDSAACAYVRALPTIDTSNIIWADDTRFVIRMLERLHQSADSGSVPSMFDLSRIGIFGHSLGGMTAEKCILEEGRLAAGISYESFPIRENVVDSIDKPFMFLQAESNRCASESAFARCRNDAYYGVIYKTRHSDFSDLCL